MIGLYKAPLSLRTAHVGFPVGVWRLFGLYQFCSRLRYRGVWQQKTLGEAFPMKANAKAGVQAVVLGHSRAADVAVFFAVNGLVGCCAFNKKDLLTKLQLPGVQPLAENERQSFDARRGLTP